MSTPGSVPASTLAITGSTGVLGGLVSRELAASGIPQRLLVRSPSRAPRLDGAIVVESAYDRSDATAEALRGVETLFMVSAAEDAQRLEQHRAFVDAAAAAGVKHVVYTSFFAAAPDATFTLARDHWATEQHIIASGMAFTFLRDNFYLDFMPDLVGEDGVIRGPAGDGAVSVVAREDIARVAAAVLRDPAAHAGATYDLTGPEALTMAEVALILSEAEASPSADIRFHNETVPEAYESRARWGAPDWQVEAWVSTYTAIGTGELAGVSDAVERITGRRGLTLAEFLAAR